MKLNIASKNYKITNYEKQQREKGSLKYFVTIGILLIQKNK